MDRSIPGGDLIGRWSLSFADIDFVNSKPALTRLGLAAQLKFFASLGFFAIDPGSIPTDGLSRSEEHTSELQSLMRNSYAVFCLKKKTKNTTSNTNIQHYSNTTYIIF